MAITQRFELNQPDCIVDPSAKRVTSERTLSVFALLKYAVLEGNLIPTEGNQIKQTQQANEAGENNLAPQSLSPDYLWQPEL